MISFPALSEAFPTFSNRSRLWAFIPATPLSAEASEEIKSALRVFVSGWKAHQRPLKADFLLLNNRLLLIAADEDFEAVSGCATDSLFRLIRELDSRLHTEFLQRRSRLLAVPSPDGSYRLLLEDETNITEAEQHFCFKISVNSLPQLKQQAWEPFQKASVSVTNPFKGLL